MGSAARKKRTGRKGKAGTAASPEVTPNPVVAGAAFPAARGERSPPERTGVRAVPTAARGSNQSGPARFKGPVDAPASPSAERYGRPRVFTAKDRWTERVFDPKATAPIVFSVVAMSIGAVLAGAGVYARWLRTDELGPHPYATYMLAAGAMVMLGVALFGHRPAGRVHVGDAGIATEKNDAIADRVRWYEVKHIELDGRFLTVAGTGETLLVSVGDHPQATAHIVAEARERVSERLGDSVVQGLDSGAIQPPAEYAGKTARVDPPQVAGETCPSSHELISLEEDARFCAQCAQHYHRQSVPTRCRACGARLR